MQPMWIAGMTVNRWCGSSIQAVQIAGGKIAMNAGEAFVAGGTECMSRVPMRHGHCHDAGEGLSRFAPDPVA